MVAVRVTVRHVAEPGDIYEPTAFVGQIGKAMPVHLGDSTLSGRLVEAEVVDGGAAARLTFDIPGLYLGKTP